MADQAQPLVRPLSLDDSQNALDEYGQEVWYQGAPGETLPEDPTPDDGENGLPSEGDVSSGGA